MAELLRPRLWQCLESVDAHPEKLLSVQAGLASDFTTLTKALYDLHKAEGAFKLGSPLSTLVIKNFDEEQIWQQLELQNNAVLGHFKKAVTQTVKDKDLYIFQQLEEEEDSEEEEEEDDDVSEIDQEKEVSEDPQKNAEDHEDKGRNGKLPLAKKCKKATVERYSDDDSDMDFDIDKLEREQKKPSQKAAKRPTEKSIVDDKFFKLSEMEAFLEAAEKEDDGKKEEDDDDEEVDYFEDIESYDDEDDDEEVQIQKTRKDAKSSRNLQYKDFFDPVDEDGIERHRSGQEDDDPQDDAEEMEEDDMVDNDVGEEEDAEDDDEEYVMEETEESEKAKEAFKRVTFDLSDGSEGEDVSDILGGKKKGGQLQEPNELKSSFEKREQKMAEKIQTLQKQMLEEKSWQLTGEVTAQKRPENSLLSESLVFDHAARMAPVITEETTLQMEDIIKQRIKDQVWDDVVRKEKPKEDAFEYKKRLTLDHDKSKQSLAEIYEQEYLKLNQKKTEEEENPKHVEIQKLMDNLFLKLDALSNFHFTPKPVVAEIKVVSNLPAISVEEVAPVGASEAALLAPEEIKEKNKAGDIKTNAEKTATDKKRERRKKKVIKRMKIKEREKRQKLSEKRNEEKGKKQIKREAEASLKKLTKEGKATLLKDEGKGKALKSSQAFFSQLQDQVKLQMKGVKAAQKKPKKNELSAHKLKL
ncbi:U3 small nucleolar ribonucleoprotein protein MPP10 [Bufo gargarizans]|uniref:U3 small nucleolar ribonucleoprotein protein MPP10 n=1 Tax=Bufo gargarizans TaxID=30331 RepID=UPI001CF52ECB|nr:U3 small nucleolar ribonucleoprotein protein MPP10 [Bufo gargarizans]